MKHTIEIENNEEVVVLNREAYNDLIKENESLLQRQENLYEFYNEKLKKCVVKGFIDGCCETVLNSLVEETNQRELIVTTSSTDAIDILNEMDRLLTYDQRKRIISNLAVKIKERLLLRILKPVEGEKKEGK